MLDKQQPEGKNGSTFDGQEIQNLIRQNAQLMKDVQGLKTQVSEKSREAEAFSAQINEIKNIRAWKTVQLLWKTKLKVFPAATRRERIARKMSKPAQPSFQTKGEVPENVQKPKAGVSIVIPVFNALAHTKQCLESIDRAHTALTVEIILVNNGSSDDTKPWFEKHSLEHPNLRMISLETNLGFGAGVNLGIRESIGEHIVILNNDTIVTSGWLEQMLDVFRQDVEIGIVSPVTNYTVKGPQLDEKAQGLAPEAAFDYAASIQDRTGFLYEPYRLAFFCIMLSRELVDRIGLIDERYETGLFEDYDYCFRAIMAGYRLAVARNAFVYHQGSVTFNANEIPYTNLLEQNQNKFYSRVDELTAGTLRTVSHGKKEKAIETSMILRVPERPVTLQRALNCLANQVYQDFEVVIVNDSGQDVSNEIDPYQGRLDITCVSGDRKHGRAHALNTAARRARGKWIGYLDPGDFLYPWHLECLSSSLRENQNFKFAYSNYNIALMKDETESVPLQIDRGVSWEFDLNELLVRNCIPIHCWLLEKEHLAQCGYLDESIDPLEDYEFLLKWTTGQDLLHLERITCEHRVYASGKRSLDIKKVLSGLRSIYSRYPAINQVTEEKRRQILRAMEDRAKASNSLRLDAMMDEETKVIANFHTGVLP